MEKIDDGVLKKLTEGQHFKAFCEKVVFALKGKKATAADQQLVLGFTEAAFKAGVTIGYDMGHKVFGDSD